MKENNINLTNNINTNIKIKKFKNVKIQNNIISETKNNTNKNNNINKIEIENNYENKNNKNNSLEKISGKNHSLSSENLQDNLFIKNLSFQKNNNFKNPSLKNLKLNNSKKIKSLNSSIDNDYLPIPKYLYQPEQFHSKSLYNLLISQKIENLNGIKYNRFKPYHNFYGQIKYQNKNNNHKKNFLSTISSNNTNYLSKKLDNGFPIIPPTFNTFNIFFKNNSEEERFRNNMNKLLNLKYFLKNHWEKKHYYIKEFFNKNKIFDKNLNNLNVYNSFALYVKMHFNKINCKKTMKEIIIDCLNNFDNLELVENNDNNNLRSYSDSYRYNYKDNFNLYNEEEYNEKKKSYKNFLDKCIYSKIIEKNPVFKINPNNIKIEKNVITDLSIQSKLYVPISKRNKKRSNYNKTSINFYDKKDIESLENEINELLNNKINDGKKLTDQFNNRIYYQRKINDIKKNTENISRKNNKLLEYIVLKKVKKNYTFHKNLFKTMNNKDNNQKYLKK